ncbi:MAG: glycosyltransferase family 2 protein [Patescibacteria group bacterium]|nr:glycosyltransferase family 2 protein [Patescibacteria group bacterium]
MLEKILNLHEKKFLRSLEIAIGLTTWLIITMPVWLSFWHPAVVAYFVLAFDLYWLYKSFVLGFNAVKSYLKVSAHIRVDWRKEAQELLGYNKTYHMVVIPEYNEPYSVLRDTISNLTKQDFPKERLIVVLATEKRDEESAETAALLKKEFGRNFGQFYITQHPDAIGEVKGKSSNMAYAAKQATRKLEGQGVDLDFVTVTSCDADALLHPKYCSYLAYAFLTDPDRKFHFYQSAIMFYSNIWKIPLPGRVLNTLGSIWSLAQLVLEKRLINFSTYSLSLATAKEVNFWGRAVIPEDYHMFFKTYFKFGDKVGTKPIFLPTLADAAESTSFKKTIINQYEQVKRWAWGVSDDPWLIKNFILHKEIPLWDRAQKLFYVLVDNHLIWPTNWFILTLGSNIPPLLNPVFARTILGHTLPLMSSIILTTCAIFLIAVVVVDMRLRPPKPSSFKGWKVAILYLQWLSLPVIGFFLSSLPGLDAHTRLLLGKRLEYRVTEKI